MAAGRTQTGRGSRDEARAASNHRTFRNTRPAGLKVAPDVSERLGFAQVPDLV
jgi:hypothetical protein